MPTYVVRVWIPDRPGALGQVASRIGAVRGDVVGIDILERGAGRAIDELVVVLPDDELVPLLVREVGQVDGVDVEDVRTVAESLPDARLDVLESAAALVEHADVATVVRELAVHARDDFEGDWAAVVDGDGSVVASAGDAPPAAWLAAFVAGSRSSGPASSGVGGADDVAWAALDGSAVAIGRRGRPFRARERRQLAALARIVGRRLTETST